MQDVLEIEFAEPIVAATVSYDRVTLTEPTGAQLVAAEKTVGGMAALLVLITLNAKVPPKVAEQMRQRDLQRAADFFGSFGKPDSSTASESAPQP